MDQYNALLAEDARWSDALQFAQGLAATATAWRAGRRTSQASITPVIEAHLSSGGEVRPAHHITPYHFAGGALEVQALAALNDVGLI